MKRNVEGNNNSEITYIIPYLGIHNENISKANLKKLFSVRQMHQCFI